MQNPFEGCARLCVLEHVCAHRTSIDGTVSIQYVAAKRGDDLRERHATGHDQLTSDQISVDHVDAEGAEAFGNRGLSAGYAAG